MLWERVLLTMERDSRVHSLLRSPELVTTPQAVVVRGYALRASPRTSKTKGHPFRGNRNKKRHRIGCQV